VTDHEQRRPDLNEPHKTEPQPANRGGMPGDGAGRREDPGETAVYPFSAAPESEEDAPVRTAAEWGQGLAGPAGHEDSGTSEVIPPGGRGDDDGADAGDAGG
jgi:hypothetical protein